MHTNSYNVKVGCISSKNFINSLYEVKSFLGFDLIEIGKNYEKSINNMCNAVIIETKVENKNLSNKIQIPKIFILDKNKKKMSNNPFELVLKLPINLVQFNKTVVELCKKYEFNKNSLIQIKGYILDKNERILKKNKISLKITEKETHFIEMLNYFGKSLSKEYILKNIWSYSSDADTHTVETHIYRLRQKIQDSFGDNNFIINTSNGYSL
tara:strand:+ start:1350 stop:1982 length:633 start_codon:yes stop_codon:yes gene_type:complete